MSKNDPRPHTVKVYGYSGGKEETKLVLRHRKEFPSKGSAMRYASEQRALPEVSSAIVIPL
jgi:hypothetical protein